MNASLARTLERFRQPEYTGENRCIPCTIVNVAIAAVLAAVVGIVAVPAGVAVFLCSLAAIYLRGYLVPGTPTLTKRYFPDWLLARFDKPPAELEAVDERDAGADADGRDDPVDPESFLLAHGVIAPCAEIDDLCLDDEVQTEWQARIAALRDGDREAQVADFLEVEPASLSMDVASDGVVARVNGRLGGRWESEAALLADLAGTDVLADRIPGWDSLELRERSTITSGLRAFVDVCPACDGPISIGEETVESCCRSHQVYAIACEECEQRVLEISQ